MENVQPNRLQSTPVGASRLIENRAGARTSFYPGWLSWNVRRINVMAASRYMVLAAAIGLAVLLGGCSAARPLHRSSASIRHSLLKRTPVGTPYHDVAAFVKHEGWPSDVSTNVPMAARPHEPMRPVVSFYKEAAGFIPDHEVKRTLNAELGSYYQWPIFDRHVQSSWLFGADGVLLEIWVWKESDSL